MGQQVEEEDEELRPGGANRPLKSGEMLAGGQFVKDSLKTEQRAAAKQIHEQMDEKKQSLIDSLGDEYRVLPGEDEFRDALGGRAPSGGTLSVKSKRPAEEQRGSGGGKGGGRGGGGGKRHKR